MTCESNQNAVSMRVNENVSVGFGEGGVVAACMRTTSFTESTPVHSAPHSEAPVHCPMLKILAKLDPKGAEVGAFLENIMYPPAAELSYQSAPMRYNPDDKTVHVSPVVLPVGPGFGEGVYVSCVAAGGSDSVGAVSPGCH